MNLDNKKIKHIHPLYDRILIEKLPGEEKTSGGIFIPNAAQEKPQIGKILATGKGKVTTTGSIIPLSVKVGDTVFFSKFSGTEVLEGYLLIREEEVLAIIEN
jgi:chaperonin GroES